MMDKGAVSPHGGKQAEACAPVQGNAYLAARRALRRPAMAAGVFSALINILMLTGSVYMLQVYDRVLSSGSLATLHGLFVIVTLAYVFYGLYEFLRSRILSRAAIRLDAIVAPAAFRAWLRSGVAGERVAGLPLRDLEVLRGFLAGPAVGALFDLPWMPLYLGVLFLIHPLMGWMTLAGAGIVVVVALANYWMTRASAERAMVAEGQARGFADNGLRQAELIGAMGMQGDVTARWRDLQGAGLAAGQAGSDVTEATSSFSKAFRMFLQSAILTLGAWLVLGQEMSAGMIIAASIISGRALAPVDQIIGQWKAISRAGQAHKRLQAFFDAQQAEPARVRLPAPTGRVAALGLTRLGPPVAAGERKRLLDRVSFDLAPGEALGVIGDSASGKSTLARLLVGSWQPDAGEIRLDGATRGQWDPADLGRHIGYLPQVAEMLPGTVRDNIARFSPHARDADLIEAARLAGVHEMILGLPQGYSTMLGGPGQPLSGGQVQRLGLARAIYGRPAIVVLDEPNANLDARGETALVEAIREIKTRGSTVILMTHRVGALAVMDKVLVLAQGAAVKYGPRDEVLENLRIGAVSSGNALSNVRPLRQPGVFRQDEVQQSRITLTGPSAAGAVPPGAVAAE